MKKKLIHYILLLVIIGSSFISCEKPPEEEDPRILPGETYEIHTEGIEKTLDEIYLYAQEVYLWNENLPPIGTVMKELAAAQLNPDNIVSALMRKIRESSKGADNFSWAMKPSTTLEPTGLYATNRYVGIRIKRSEVGGSYKVLMVWPNSPAYNSGLKRGSILYENVKLSHNQLIYNYWQTVKDIPQPIKMFQLLNGGIKLNSVPYVGTHLENTVTGQRRIGYLLYERFDYQDRASVDQAFGVFIANDITDLVIDLRYNTEGDMEMLSYLESLVLPSNLMYQTISTQRTNKTVALGKAKVYGYLFENAGFNDNGELASVFNNRPLGYIGDRLKNIYVIVSKQTEGPSELFIHHLLPYIADGFKLTIIGEQTRGKGIHAIPKKIGEYQVDLMSIQNFNSYNQQLDPKFGIVPNVNVETDDTTYPIGDPRELCFRTILDPIRLVTVPKPGGGN